MKKLKSVKRLINIDGSTPGPINCKEARADYNKTCEENNRLKSELNDKKIGLIIDKENYKKNHPNCDEKEYKDRLQQVVEQKKIIINSDKILKSGATKKEKDQARAEKNAANSVINNIPGGREQLYTTASFKIAFDKQKSRIDKLEKQLKDIKNSMQNRNPKCKNIPPDCTTPK